MVYGLWFMVYGLGFRVWGLGFRVFAWFAHSHHVSQVCDDLDLRQALHGRLVSVSRFFNETEFWL